MFPIEKKRVSWSNLETHFMLTIMGDKIFLTLLDGKRFRNTEVFDVVGEELKKRGFFKTVVQIRAKWKQLKINFYKCKRLNNTGGAGQLDCPFWEELDELLGNRPASGIDGGVDTIPELEEMDVSLIESEDSNIETIPHDVAVVVPSTPVERVSIDGLGAGLSVEIAGSRTALSSEDSEVAGPSGSTSQSTSKINKTRNKERRGYKEALQSFSKEWKASMEDTAGYFLEKQEEVLKRQLEEQRKWEKETLEEERNATETMLNNVMKTCFDRLNSCVPQTQFPIFPKPFAVFPKVKSYNILSPSSDESSTLPSREALSPELSPNQNKNV